MSGEERALLVGDNPFHGISHLSQERSRVRGASLTNPEYAADLVSLSMENGANGFMFSVSETTLSILEILREKEVISRLDLYAIVPYAYEYVRFASQMGGIPLLAKRLVKEILISGNLRAAGIGLKGLLKTDLEAIAKTYLLYEILRVRSFAGKKARLSFV